MALNGTIQGFRLFSSPSPGRNFMPNFVERFFFVLLLFCDKLFLSYKSISFKRIFFALFRSEYFSKQTDYI